MVAPETVIAAVVGIDGCGKSSAFRGALELLAGYVDIVGIGDEVLAGAPGIALHERTDLPLQRVTRAIGRIAKRTHHACAYRQLKTIDLIGRSRMRDHVVAEETPAALLSDGDPLVNTISWSVGRLYRDELLGDDERVLDAVDYLSGERRIPRSQLPYYLRHAWQLAAVNRLGIARFGCPDLVILLQLDPAEAMARIRGRGRVLQAHETVAALGALGVGYDRVCRLLETHRGVRVLRIQAAETPMEATARLAADALLELLPGPPQPQVGDPDADAIEVVATTISGSLQDQHKVGRIGPRFEALTRRSCRVHVVDSHAEARSVARDIVAGGGRVIVSAGGAGTFNAVLEGCHRDGRVPSGVRLAFLRKGSADLIGKMLRIPDDLGAAVTAIVDGIESDRRVAADVLAVEATGLDGPPVVRHLVGFGGLGIFGAVPRFTEARWVKYYKGFLGSMFGDYGPFYAGLALATAWWYGQRLSGRVAPLVLELDDETFGPATWDAVIVVGGDLGRAFPLGRDLSLSSGTFRVVALRDLGLVNSLRQLAAARTGAILDDPARYGCLVREVRSVEAHTHRGRSGRMARTFMVNVDGLLMHARDGVRITVSGRVDLVAGPELATAPDPGLPAAGCQPLTTMSGRSLATRRRWPARSAMAATSPTSL